MTDTQKEWWREEPYRIRGPYSDWFDIEKIITEAERRAVERRDGEIRKIIEERKQNYGFRRGELCIYRYKNALDYVLSFLNPKP